MYTQFCHFSTIYALALVPAFLQSTNSIVEEMFLVFHAHNVCIVSEFAYSLSVPSY